MAATMTKTEELKRENERLWEFVQWVADGMPGGAAIQRARELIDQNRH